MRMAFGLVSLLVCVGIIMYMMSEEIKPGGPVRQGLKAQDEAAQIAGIGVRESVTFDTVENNGKVTAIAIKSLVSGGPFEKFYGVQQGDKVVEIGPFRVRDEDTELAEAQLLEGPQRQMAIVVDRDGQKLTLPANGNGSTANGGGSPISTLQQLQSVPTH